MSEIVGEVQRIRIPPPLNPTPYDGWSPAVAFLPGKVRVQVNAYTDEHGNVLERWLLDETDERWYQIERFTFRRLSVAVKRKTVPGNNT